MKDTLKEIQIHLEVSSLHPEKKSRHLTLDRLTHPIYIQCLNSHLH